MADFIEGVRLTSVQLAVDGQAHCPLCGAVTSSIEIPLLVQSSIPMSPGRVDVFIRAGTPILNACGHELPVASRIVAAIRDGEPGQGSDVSADTTDG